MKVKLMSFPKDGSSKVPGIKAIRSATGLGLKSAKELIEDLQVNTWRIVDIRDRSALTTFVEQGGNYLHLEDALVEQLKEVVSGAIEVRSYGLAADIIEVLKNHDAS